MVGGEYGEAIMGRQRINNSIASMVKIDLSTYSLWVIDLNYKS
jgi:hypothetical protein